MYNRPARLRMCGKETPSCGLLLFFHRLSQKPQPEQLATVVRDVVRQELHVQMTTPKIVNIPDRQASVKRQRTCR